MLDSSAQPVAEDNCWPSPSELGVTQAGQGAENSHRSAPVTLPILGNSLQRRLPFERRVHVSFIRLDAGLTVRVDSHQSSFDYRGQHQHLE